MRIVKNIWGTPRKKVFIAVTGGLLILGCTACGGAVKPQAVDQSGTEAVTLQPETPILPITPTTTPASSDTPQPPPTNTQTPLPSPTTTATTTAIPTYVVLRGEVLQRSNCRYGPGAPYLYKYGLVPGSNLEVIGRNDLGTWILVQAIGGNNPCWVKASLMDIKGDVMNVAPTYIPLPQSPYYGPPEWVQASRDGDEVHIYWQAIYYRAGDETAEAPYLIEAWICTGGELVFTPIGVYETQTWISDEAGCSQPSHGRLYFVEKHGYSRWIEIPWPTQ